MNANEQVEAAKKDLYDRAMSLGYTSDSAARMADCFTNWDMISDPCTTHPNHSVSTSHQGYAVDMCEACKVVELTDAAGYTQPAQADLYCADGKCGTCADCVECAQVVEPPKGFDEAMAETERDEAYAAWVAGMANDPNVEIIGGHPYSRSGLPIFRNVVDRTPGILARHRAQVERDEQVAADFAAQRAAVVRADNDDSDRSGVEILRELLILEPVKAPKVKAVHLDILGSKAPCGAKTLSSTGNKTTNPGKVTCKRCVVTSRYASAQHAATRATQRAAWAAAGIRTSMVVRELISGRLGVVTSLDSRVAVGFWAPVDGQPMGRTFTDADLFWAGFAQVNAMDLMKAGTELVWSAGTCATVYYVSPDVVTFTRGDGTQATYGLGDIAAEISRGLLAIVPTAKCPVPHCGAADGALNGHEHFGHTPVVYFR